MDTYRLTGANMLKEKYLYNAKMDREALSTQRDYQTPFQKSATDMDNYGIERQSRNASYEMQKYIQNQVYEINKRASYIADKFEAEIYALKKDNENMQAALMELAKVIDELQNNQLEPLEDLR